MSASSSAPLKPSGIKPPTSRLVRPSVTTRPSSNGSSGENISRKSTEDLTKKKISDRSEGLDDDGDLDRVSELRSLPGSRKTSEQMRKLSDGSGSALDAAYELARRLSEAGVRRMSDASIVLTTDTDSFIIGQRIYVNGVKPGVIQFIGETKFAPGEWAGIVLDDLSGKNDGSVGGVRYFQCQPKKGVFSRLTRLTRQPLDAIQLAALQTQQSQPTTANENGEDSPSSAANTNGVNSTMTTSPSATSPSSVVSVQSIGDLRLGDRVIVTSSQGSKAGVLRYLGTAEFAVGQWAGVELDDPLGKNDGAVAGTRYFECQQNYGLFAPVHKVSRSPANQMRRTSGALNSSMNSSVSQRTGLMSRQSTRDSISSDRASITSAATSRASTAISRVRSTVNNPRLGVNSLTSPTHPSVRQKTSRPSVGGSTHGNLQDLLRERDQHIEQLMKEREMERSEVTRAAAQADEAEHQLALLQRKFKEERETFASKIDEMERLLVAAESIRSTQTAQIDDLQFRLEEESILRSDLEAQQKGMDDKEKEWARQVEQLESEAQRCFEAEELAARYKDELDALTAKGQQEESSAPEGDPSNERIRQLETSVQTKEAELLKLNNSMRELSKSLDDEQLKCRNTEERLRILETELETTKKSLDDTKENGDSELNQLKAKLEQLEQTKADSEEQLFKLTEDKVQLEIQLNAAQTLLEQTKDSGGKESVELRAQLESLTRQDAENKEQIKQHKEDKIQLEAQLSASLATSNQAKRDIEMEVKELKEKLDEFERRATETEEQLFKMDEEKVRLESELAAALASSEQLKRTGESEMKELKEKLDQFERRALETEEQLFKMDEEKVKLESQLAASLASSDQTKHAGETELNELKQKLDQFERRAAETENQLFNLNEEKVRLELQLTDSKESITKLNESGKIESEKAKQELDDLKNKTETLERQKGELEDQLAKLNENKIHLEMELKAVQSLLVESQEAAKLEIENKTKEFNELKSNYEILERQSEDVKVQFASLQEEKIKSESALQKKCEEETEKWSNKCDDFEKQKAANDQRLCQLDEEKSRLESELLHLSSSSSNTSQDLTRLHGELMAARQSLVESQSLVSKHEQDRTSLEQNNNNLRSDLQKRDDKIKELSSIKADLDRQIEETKLALKDAQTQLEKDKAEWERSNGEIRVNLQNEEEKVVQLTQVQKDLQGQLEKANANLSDLRVQSEKEKAEWEQSNGAITSDLVNKDKQIADLLSTTEKYENDLKNAKEECSRLKEQLKALESLQQESACGVVDLQKSIAVLELEKSNWLADKLRLEESVSRLESQLSTLSSEKEESGRKIEERDSRLAQLTEEVTLLKDKFTKHVAELEHKLNENRKAEVTEQELQAALNEARSHADKLQTDLEESKKKEQELIDARDQLASANKLHEEYIQQTQKEANELKHRIDELSDMKDSVQERESKLQDELNALKRQLDEQNSRLQNQLHETKQEAETVRQLLLDLEDSQKRVKELQLAVEESDQRLTETQEIALRVKGLEEQLELKTVELKEEMDDRDKAEDRVLRLTESLSGKEKELEAMRHEVTELKKSTTDVSHLLTAFSTVDREKKQLEAKVVELQVAAAAASRGAGAEAAETDVRIKQLKDDYEMSQREISFLNSVIVDMQRKVDELKLKLEVSQATILGQNVLTPENNRNGVKAAAVAPRLFCDICDLFDLHDTEDCPKQSSEDFESAPVLLKHHSPVYTQHSHHGGTRGASRPYCDNCEVFGHSTDECLEEATF